MRIFSRSRDVDSSANPLVPVVRPLSAAGKQAMYRATNNGVIKRRTWDGCAFNRAGTELGTVITTRRQAAAAFDTTPAVISRFISVWDQLPGSNDRCTQLLRDALEEVGLFTEPEETKPRGVRALVGTRF